MAVEVIELTKKLISIPSISGSENAIVEYAANYLGFCKDVVHQEVEKGRCNILAHSIEDEKLPTVIINGHLDTVSPVSGWNGHEYTPRIQDNRLYGLGSADQKAGVAIALTVFRDFYKKSKVNIEIKRCETKESRFKKNLDLLYKTFYQTFYV